MKSNQTQIYKYPYYFFSGNDNRIGWAYSIDNQIVTYFGNCRTTLSEKLAEDFHNEKLFQQTNPEILIQLSRSLWKNFKSNLGWFNLWQQHLGFTNLQIKNSQKPIYLQAKGDPEPQRMDDLHIIKIDHRWFKMGTMHNTFVTFILKLMMLAPNLPVILNKDTLYKSIMDTYMEEFEYDEYFEYDELEVDIVDEISYLHEIGWDYFLFLLKQIHNIKQDKPFGYKNDTWQDRHVMSGFVEQSRKMKSKYNTTNLLTLTSRK